MPLDLEATLRDANVGSFPNRGNYYSRYASLKDYMDNNVHKDVVLGAITRDGGLLNDHGPEHIRTVIARAGCMLSGKGVPGFTPYEAYLFLCAAHFHDVGNIFGREGHEKRHADIMQDVRPLLGNDSTEINCICRIAYAHGGHIDGDKDKIGLLEDDPVNGQDIRVRLLAAVLRFADELADDKHRANRFLLEHNLVPEEAEVFHKYAASLDSVMVRPDDGRIELYFCLSTEDATQLWGKKSEKVYLIDEIYLRTMKMHLERCYCSRFMQSLVELKHINVRIEIFDTGASFGPPRKRIGYRLEESGYPGAPDGGIHTLCNDLNDGAHLAKWLAEGSVI